MTSAAWARVKDLFDEAIQLPIAERYEYLQSACDSQEQLHELRALVSQHETIGFLDQTGPSWLRGIEDEPVFRSGDSLCERFEVFGL